MGTILVALGLTAWMVMSPGRALMKLMQLTRISSSFKANIVILGLAYLFLAWVGERYLFPRLARAAGNVHFALTKKAKKRKEYKVIAENMQF